MRGDPRTSTLLRPKTPGEALALLLKEPRALPLAGGTDLMVLWNLGLYNERTFLDLSRLRSWRKIAATKRGLTLGALVRHADMRDDKAVNKSFPLLARACAEIGGLAIQNRGTLGGNLGNASPAGDTFPALAVYEAVVNIASANGRRRLPVLELFAGVKKTTLRPGELIESVELPFPARPPDRQAFRKIATRAAQALSKAVAAGLLWLNKDGSVEALRFAVGSVAPTVRRLRAAEAFVRGKQLTPDVCARAGELAAADISPIDDVRSTAEYRLFVTQRLLENFLKGQLK